MKQLVFVLLAAAVLNGCSASSSLTPAMQADLVKPIYCEGASECKTMWKRAFQFVNQNAGYPITTANPTLIHAKVFETNQLGFDKYKLGMKVTKSPLGYERYQLKVYADCFFVFGSCRPNAEETLWRAQLFIREGKE
jgi:hypothetical protein